MKCTIHQFINDSKSKLKEIQRNARRHKQEHLVVCAQQYTKLRSNVQAHIPAGIAVGWSNVASGLQVYNPITKELYTTSSVFKIDKHNATKSYFNLKYDGDIFSGLYSLNSRQNAQEFYPIGTAVKVPSNTGSSEGYIISIPADNHCLQTPIPYTQSN